MRLHELRMPDRLVIVSSLPVCTQSRLPPTIVEVFIPLPTPATILPTIICGIPYAVVCSTAPIVKMKHPNQMQFFRPSLSPANKQNNDPAKQPIS